jgi:hypothetical protein
MPGEVKDQEQQPDVNDNYRGDAARGDQRQLPAQDVMPGR